MVANYQSYHHPSGGGYNSGYLRLVEFLPDGVTVQVKTYSPYHDTYLTDPDNEFTFVLRATGDITGDGKVDGHDLAIWQQEYDPLGVNPLNRLETGDMNSDGRIDGTDLAIWQRNYNPLGSGFSGVGVPEPTTLVLLMTGSAALLGSARRRQLG